MNATPALTEGLALCHELSLSDLPVTIGRGAEAHITVADRWVSRQHCEISEIDGTVVVRDLGSSHGTHVNGQRIDETTLHSGDRLGIGLTSFIAMLDDHAVTLVASAGS
jgi:pSer/pThr/pTyr-binding forkhead associated (FHA) protein